MKTSWVTYCFPLLAAMLAAAVLCTLPGCATPPMRSPSVLVVAVSPGKPPLCYKTSKGLVGMEIDFAKALAAELNKKPVFMVVPRKQLVKTVAEGKADIAMSGLSPGEATAANVVASDPYLRTGQMALTTEKEFRFKGSFRTLLISAVKIGVVKGSRGQTVAMLSLGKSRVKEFPDIETALKELEKYRLDMLISEAPAVIKLAATRPGLMACLPLLSDETLCWAVHEENDVLLTQVNACLEGWKQIGQHDAIVEHWIPDHKAYGMAVFESDRPDSYQP